MTGVVKPQPESSTQEVLAGLVERVTFHNADNGFCVLRTKARGHRDLATVVGHAAMVSAGEWITASGEWINDRTHGQQFKARFLRTSEPSSIEGIEKYLGSGRGTLDRRCGDVRFEVIRSCLFGYHRGMNSSVNWECGLQEVGRREEGVMGLGERLGLGKTAAITEGERFALANVRQPTTAVGSGTFTHKVGFADNLVRTREVRRSPKKVRWRVCGLGLGILCAAAISIGEASARPCSSPDLVTRVTGGNECLVIHTFGAVAGNRTLVVFVHGDGSKGGPSDYLARAAERVSGNGVTAVALIRPGYYDSNDAKSTGNSYRRDGDGYRDDIIAAVAGAVSELKSHHGAERVVLVGHSGGAAISGIILGRYAGLVSAAVLAACPCNIDKWRRMRGRRPWNRSRSPHTFVDAVSTKAFHFSRAHNRLP